MTVVTKLIASVVAIAFAVSGCSSIATDDSGSPNPRPVSSSLATVPTTTVGPSRAVSATTTSLSPNNSLSAAERRLVDGFVTAFNAGDLDALMKTFTDDTLYRDDLVTPTGQLGRVANFVGLIRDGFQWRVAVQQQIRIDECTRLDSGAMSCKAQVSDGITTGGNGPVAIIVKIQEVDGHFGLLELNNNGHDRAPAYNLAYSMLVIWLQDNYPGDDTKMLDFDRGPMVFPRLTDESLALWGMRVAQYAQSATE